MSYQFCICRFALFLVTLFAGFAVHASHGVQEHPQTKHDLYHEPIQPIPLPAVLQPAKIELGKKLFHDTRLSSNNELSCSSCHLLDINGASHMPRSIGKNGVLLDVNTPTVFNSSLNQYQFWDGRANSLEHQIDFVVKNGKEFATNWATIIRKLKKDPEYKRDFKQLYKEGLTPATVRNALAVYQQTLLTLDAPFDRYLLGDEKAISPLAKKGYKLFKHYGCVACHQGSNVGGNLFMRIGVFGDYFADRKKITTADLGRYNITKRDEDKFVFRVPSLRLAAITAPYFHDGSVDDLSEAIRIMAKYQLGRRISDNDIKAIKAFIYTLVGRYNNKNLLSANTPVEP